MVAFCLEAYQSKFLEIKILFHFISMSMYSTLLIITSSYAHIYTNQTCEYRSHIMSMLGKGSIFFMCFRLTGISQKFVIQGMDTVFFYFSPCEFATVIISE